MRLTKLAGMAVLATNVSLSAATINLSTGLDAANTLIATGGVNDAHWTTGGNPAETVYPGDLDWGGGPGGVGGWLSNGPNSAWIAKDSNSLSGNAVTYSVTFDLTGIDLATVQLTGAWAVDDAGTVVLNGHTIGTLGPGNWGVLTPIGPFSNAFFNPGINTLSIVDDPLQTDNISGGVRFDGSVLFEGSVLTDVPEPATITLLGLGLAASTLVRVRRRR